MVVDTIDMIDLHLYELTKYEVNDYVLRRFPKNRRWKPGQIWFVLAGTLHRDESVISAQCLRTAQALVHYSQPHEW